MKPGLEGRLKEPGPCQNNNLLGAFGLILGPLKKNPKANSFPKELEE